LTDFSYIAFELSGRRLTGTVTASDRESALATISSSGVRVLELKENGSASKKRKEDAGGGVSRSELALFTRRLADLSGAGLPLDRALGLTGEQTDNPALRAVVEEAIKDVRAGTPVSDALAKHPRLFPPVFTLTLRAGEASGQFPKVADRLADLQQIQVKRRSQIVGAMIYPCVLALASIGVISFLMLFVVPKLAAAFKDLHAQLPATTTALIGSSQFLMGHILWILGSLLAVVAFARVWARTPQGSLLKDRWLLSLPVVGPIASKAAISRYSRVLSTLVYGGVPILESLQIAGSAAGNRVLEVATKQVQSDVREGRRISGAMKDTGAFSNLLVQMVMVGEETGDLPTMLTRVSDTLDFEVDTGMQKLMALMEPVTVLFMGAFVGFVVLSVLMPIYQAPDLIK
jgi:type II secretory pathway component PulF